MDVPPLDGTDWVDQIARWMHSYRRALAEHPNLIPLLTEHTMTAGGVLRGYDRVAPLLLARAPTPGGAALDQRLRQLRPGRGAGPRRTRRGVADEVEDLPALDEALSAAPRGRRRADEAFEIGLRALLDGLRERLSGGA